MTRKGLIACIALAALGAAATWLARTERGGARELDSAAPRAAVERPAAELAPAAAPEDEPLARVATPDAGRAPAELGATIDGRVVTDHGLPDEEIFVDADAYVGTPFTSESRVKRRARVARDGTFELAVPGDARFALLGVDSPSLELDDHVRAEPGERGVVLRARWLATLEVRLVPPPGIASTAEAWRGVVATCSRGERGLGVARAFPDERGVLALRRLPLGVGLLLKVEHPFGPEHRALAPPFDSGERRELVVQLAAGVALEGRVVDERGEPVVGANVEVRPTGERGWEPTASSTTDGAGAFRIADLAARRWRVRVADRFADSTARDVDASAGDVRGIELSVVRGACVRGLVRWSDGAAVGDGSVLAYGPSRRSEDLGRGGEFELCALLPGTYSLEVRGGRGGRRGFARLHGVSAGGEPLEVVLEPEPTFRLEGLVLDESGSPVRSSRVQWTCRGESGFASTARALPGAFVLEELPAGDVVVSASAKGYRSARRTATAGPGASETLRIVLRKAGVVRGRVVDASGAPVAGAQIHGGDSAVTSSSNGTFACALAGERATLYARAPGYGPSASVEVALAPGEVREGVVLELRPGCRVAGRVLDSDGRPCAGAFVQDLREGWESLPQTETDADGRFELGDLAPGEAQLHAATRDGARAAARALVAPGAASEVELRFQAADPVRLSGRVTRGGAPLACGLSLNAENFFARTTAGADGRFEVELRGHGPVRGWAWLAGSFESRSFELDVPDAASHEVELDFDAMTVVGD